MVLLGGEGAAPPSLPAATGKGGTTGFGVRGGGAACGVHSAPSPKTTASAAGPSVKSQRGVVIRGSVDEGAAGERAGMDSQRTARGNDFQRRRAGLSSRRMKNALLSIHVIAVISWMAGILYLYRLIVYHVEETEALVRSRFVVMERRLYRFITVPAMIVAAVAGAAVVTTDVRYYARAHWLHGKLLLVALLIGSTLHAGRVTRRLAAGDDVGPGRRYRLLNEVPTLLMIGIVILVIVKPF